VAGFLYIGFFVLGFIGLPIGLGLLFYFVPKKLGYPKTGKFLTIIFGLFILTIILMAVFEEQLFTKNDARKLIEEQKFKLTDEFDIENYKSASLLEDYYHTFTLTISEKDRLKLIQQIKHSEGYKKLGQPTTDFIDYRIKYRYIGQEKTQDYETENEYVREFFKPNGQGYAPTFRRISIDKKVNKLTFEEY